MEARQPQQRAVRLWSPATVLPLLLFSLCARAAGNDIHVGDGFYSGGSSLFQLNVSACPSHCGAACHRPTRTASAGQSGVAPTIGMQLRKQETRASSWHLRTLSISCAPRLLPRAPACSRLLTPPPAFHAHSYRQPRNHHHMYPRLPAVHVLHSAKVREKAVLCG